MRSGIRATVALWGIVCCLAPAGRPARAAEEGTTKSNEPAPDVAAAHEPPPAPPRIYPQPDLRHATERYRALVAPTAREQAIYEMLERPGDFEFDFQETPLRAVIARFRETFGVPVVADISALTDAGIDLDATTITRKLAGISLRSALRLVLRETDLTYLVRDEALVITTREKAQENLLIKIYPVPLGVPMQVIIDLVQSTVAVPSWNTVGGPGAIQPCIEKSVLVVSQTQEVHEEIEDLFNGLLNDNFGPSARDEKDVATQVPTRIHGVRDPEVLEELQQKLVTICNTALGADGDPDAKVSTLGGRLVVQSRKRAFHVYAAEVIQSVSGVEAEWPVTGQSGIGVMGMGGTPFCWVAREVYGPHDPRWLGFRSWMLARAPEWLRDTYATHGEAFAGWLRDKPVAKAAVRGLMDAIVAGVHPAASLPDAL